MSIQRFPFAHTFSIVARDPVNGEMGVAVQSHWFSTGSIVTWAEPGVGAVATQSMVEVSYGPLGLAGLREHKDPQLVLSELLKKDENSAVRQVAMVEDEQTEGQPMPKRQKGGRPAWQPARRNRNGADSPGSRHADPRPAAFCRGRGTTCP